MATATGQTGERWWEEIRPRIAIVTLFLILLLALSLQNRVTDPDLWWHLRTGQWILEEGRIPYTDPFSFTMQGRPWIAHSWLAELAMYLLYRYVGAFSLPLLRSLLQVATLGLLLKMLWERWPRLWGNLALILLCMLASTKFWLARPNSASLALFVVVLYLWYLYKWHGCNRLWLLPPLMALWANLHGGYIQGLLLLGVLFIGEALAGRLWPDPVPMERRRWLRFGLYALLCIPAVMLNPYGPRLLLYPFGYYLGPTSVFTRYIGEWLSTDFQEPSSMLFAILLFALTAAIAWRRVGLGPAETSAVLLFSGMAFSSVRVGGLAVPLLTWSIAGVLGQGTVSRLGAPVRRGAWPRPSKALRWGWYGGTAFMSLLLLAVIGVDFVTWGRKGGFVEEKDYPREAVTAIAELPSSARIFNTYNWGGYLIWRLYPQHPVFIDGRVDLFAADLLDDYLQVHRVEPTWSQVLADYEVSVVICERRSPLAAVLMESAAWKPTYQDDIAMVFQRAPSR